MVINILSHTVRTCFPANPIGNISLMEILLFCLHIRVDPMHLLDRLNVSKIVTVIFKVKTRETNYQTHLNECVKYLILQSLVLQRIRFFNVFKLHSNDFFVYNFTCLRDDGGATHLTSLPSLYISIQAL